MRAALTDINACNPSLPYPAHRVMDTLVHIEE
jgi:hypothetical protein